MTKPVSQMTPEEVLAVVRGRSLLADVVRIMAARDEKVQRIHERRARHFVPGDPENAAEYERAVLEIAESILALVYSRCPFCSTAERPKRRIRFRL